MNLGAHPFDDSSAHGILQAVAWGLRSTYHSALRASPGQLTFGRDMILQASYLANWHYVHSLRRRNVIRSRKRLSGLP